MRWPAHRPEPEPGDVVRLNVDGGRAGGPSGSWASARTEHGRDGADAVGLALDVVPAPEAD